MAAKILLNISLKMSLIEVQCLGNYSTYNAAVEHHCRKLSLAGVISSLQQIILKVSLEKQKHPTTGFFQLETTICP